MKVLIITYYWPPSGGSGVQRWLQFVKYLRDFQIEPIVYTVENPNYALIDTSLQQEIPEGIEILKQPIWEPNDILSFFKSNKKQTSSGFLNPNPSFFEKILLQIRANYFIPDSRKYWVKPSVAYLYNYLKNNHIYAIITTGPPHSVHLIGLALKRKTGVKWISDFRDPWTDIDYFHQLPLSEKSREKHFLLEKEVLEKSDAVLVVGKTMKEKYAAFNQNVHVITNGFDGEINVSKNKQRDIFTITHIGLMNSDRNSVAFWEVLQELIVENNAFAEAISVQLIGKVAKEVKETISKYGLENVVKIIDYVPYNEVQKFQNEAQVLLLVVNNVPAAKGILTGKIFEYLQARRPIFAIGPTDGDLAEIIQKTGSGVIVDYEDKKAIENCILSYFKNFKEGNLVSQGKNIEQYHRKNLTQQLSEVIKNL